MPQPVSHAEHAHPIAPDAATWAAMSPRAREEFLDAVNAFHSDPAEAMSEGRPHKRAKNEALDALGLHFSRLGRVVYLADEMSVLYPGERTFVPDILAVVGVPQPDDDPRQAWVVLEERRGLDLVIEVLNTGDRRKDLVRNVEWYARLGIPEYFVYDRRNQRLFGWRLPEGGDIYASMKPDAGRLVSTVLGLELAVVDGHLRFYTGHSELYGSSTLLNRLAEMVDSVEARVDAAEHARDAALSALRGVVLTILTARGLEVPAHVRNILEAESDPAALARLATQAAVVDGADALFD